MIHLGYFVQEEKENVELLCSKLTMLNSKKSVVYNVMYKSSVLVVYIVQVSASDGDESVAYYIVDLPRGRCAI